MKTGYLINIENPNFSGIATLTFCSRKPKINPPAPGVNIYAAQGKVTRCYVESGFGVRQLAAALGSHFEYAGPRTKLRFEIGDFNMLTSFEVVD